MTVVSINGAWGVRDDEGYLLVMGLTNAGAWRWIDQNSNDPLSPAQKRSDYAWSKALDE